MNSRAQTWSMDVVLAVVIFGFIAVSVTSFALLDQPDVQTLQQNAQAVSGQLDEPVSGCEAAFEGDTLDTNATQCLFSMDYDQLKDELNLRGDFCIYLEAEDGTLIPVQGKNAQGSGQLIVGGKPCGQ